MQNMHKQVLILAGSQAVFQSVTILLMTVGGLAGLYLAPDPAWATIPLAMGSLGTALIMFPASIMMSRKGRRAGFLTGAASGIVSAGMAVAAMFMHSFWLLCLAMLMLGIYQAFAQFYRFAAGEVATEAFRTRAISLVIAGGVVAAFAGPFLARTGSNLLPVPYAGSFILMGMMSLVGVLLLTGLQIPAEYNAESSAVPAARPWRKVLTQPAYLVALFSAASAYGIMVLAMTATPIAMANHGYTLSQSATVIQLHVLGMYLPSFFTGRLAGRFGSVKIMLSGVVMLLGYVLVALSGKSLIFFAGALILAGTGWNFLYIGATSLLSTTYSGKEKGVAQAVNDMSVFIFTLLCSVAAGTLLNTVGWQNMNKILVPWVIVLALPLFWLAWRRRKPAAVLA
ncbi:MFS transporter [Franconibacter pulveris]|uniref:MFS transporter n=1 Tax=Franconibacter pulveris TaxID=435910 RepID=UPI0004980593|nr:MFS transporter [Franconibacter pulveris]